MTKNMTANLFLLFLLASSACAREAYLLERESSIWDVIRRLSLQMPFKRDAFEKDIGTQLTLKKRDQHMSHWVGSQVRLADGVEIVSTSLVLDPADKFDSVSGATIYLSGTCIGIDEIKDRYVNVLMIDSPRGHSLQDETVYRSVNGWGELVFSFSETSPDCLAYLTFRGP